MQTSVGNKLLLKTAAGPIFSIDRCELEPELDGQMAEVLDDTPDVLSVGRLTASGWAFVWMPRQLPILTSPSGRQFILKLQNYVPVLDSEVLKAAKEKPEFDTEALHQYQVLPVAEEEQSEIVQGPAPAVDQEVPAVDLEAEAESEEEPTDPTKIALLKSEASSIPHLMTHLPSNPFCEFCLAKRRHHRRTRVSAAQRDAERPKVFGARVGVDHGSLGSNQRVGSAGERAFLSITDKASNFSGIYPNASKNAASTTLAFRHFKGTAKIDEVVSDNAPELIRSAHAINASSLCSRPWEPQSNGQDEAKINKILGGGRCLMKQSGLPSSWWPSAIKYFGHALNLMKPKGSLLREPWFIRHKKAFPAPLIPFGCLVSYLPKSPNMELGKFDSRARTGIFIGYHLQDGCKYRSEMLVADLLKFADSETPNPIMRIHDKEVFFDPKKITFPLAIARKQWEDKELEKSLKHGGPEPENEGLELDQGLPQQLVDDEDEITVIESSGGSSGSGESNSKQTGEQPQQHLDTSKSSEPTAIKTEQQPQQQFKGKEKLPTGPVGRPPTNKPGDVDYEQWKNFSKARRERETKRWREQEEAKAKTADKQNTAPTTIVGQTSRQHVVEASTLAQSPDGADDVVGALVCASNNSNRLFVEFACSDNSELSKIAVECGAKALRLSRKFADLRSSKGLKKVIAELQNYPKHLHVDLFSSMPCTPWCQWHFLNAAKIEGFAERLEFKRRDSFAMLANLVKLVAFIKGYFRSYTVSKEWPKSATGWKTTKVINAAAKLGLLHAEVIHGCAFDVKNAKGEFLLKPWLIRSTHQPLCESLKPYKCDKSHKHARTEGSATEPTGFYNRTLATTLLEGLGYQIIQVTTTVVAQSPHLSTELVSEASESERDEDDAEFSSLIKGVKHDECLPFPPGLGINESEGSDEENEIDFPPKASSLSQSLNPKQVRKLKAKQAENPDTIVDFARALAALLGVEHKQANTKTGSSKFAMVAEPASHSHDRGRLNGTSFPNKDN